MAQLIQLVKSAPTILTPATIEASDFVQRVKLGEWIQAEFRRVRNYQYHKRFSNFCNLVSTTGRQPVVH